MTAYPDESVHDAVARMLTHAIGRLPVVSRDNPKKLVGYLSRTSLLSARLRTVRQETVRDDGWIWG